MLEGARREHHVDALVCQRQIRRVPGEQPIGALGGLLLDQQIDAGPACRRRGSDEVPRQPAAHLEGILALEVDDPVTGVEAQPLGVAGRKPPAQSVQAAGAGDLPRRAQRRTRFLEPAAAVLRLGKQKRLSHEPSGARQLAELLDDPVARRS